MAGAGSTVGQAIIRLGFDGDSLQASLDKQTSKISKAAEQVGTGSGKKFSTAVSTAAGNILSGAISKGVGVLNSHLSGAISRVDTLNNAPKTFAAMGYSVDDVNDTMSMLNTYLDGLPTSMDTAIGEVQTLSASFGGLKNGTKYFQAMNDAGLAFGSTSADIERAIVQLSQIDLNGPLDAATWNSLRNAGFEPVFAAMAQEAGVTVGQLKESFGKDGTKTVQDFLDSLVEMDAEGTSSMQSLADMARTNTSGIGTAMENLSNRINKALAQVVNDIGAEKISGWINDFSSQLPALADKIAGLAKNVADFVQFLIDHQDAVVSVSKVILGASAALTAVKKATAAAKATITGVSGAIKIASATFSAFGAVISGLSSGMSGLVRTVSSVGKAISSLKAVGNLSKIFTLNPAILVGILAIGAAIAATIALWPQIQEFFGNIGAAFQAFWEPIQQGFDWFSNNVIAPVKDFLYNVTIAGIALVTLAVQAIWDKLVGLGNWLDQNFFTPIKNTFTQLGQDIQNTFETVKNWISTNVVAPVASAFGTLGTNISNAFQTAKENIKKAIQPIVNWFNDNVRGPIEVASNKIKDTATTAFQSIKDTVSNIFSTIGGIVKAPINGVIGGVNNVLGSMNNLKIPDWVPGLGGKSPHFGMIPMLAGGGFADQATPAVFGEAGAEVVLPLERNTDNWSGLLASALTRAMDEQDTTSGRPIYVNMTNEINNDMDAEDIGRVLMTSIRRAA